MIRSVLAVAALATAVIPGLPSCGTPGTVPWVQADCVTPEGAPFQYVGPSGTMPEGCVVVQWFGHYPDEANVGDPLPPVVADISARSAPTDAVSSGDQTVLDLQLDPEATLAGRRMHECITPSGWRFDYYEPVGGGALPPGADCTRLTVRP